MLPSWAGDAITVERPPMVERRGTTVPDWAHAQTHEVSGCSVQIPTTSMSLDVRTQTELAGTVYAPPTADIKAGDRITFGTARFLVNGEPMPWRSPTGRVSHLQARIVAWRG